MGLCRFMTPEQMRGEASVLPFSSMDAVRDGLGLFTLALYSSSISLWAA